MREKGGTLEILFGARFDGHTVRRSGIESIAVARPTEEDKAGVASASIILKIGVAGLILVCLGVVLVGVFEVRASRRRLIDGPTMQEATVTRLREEQQRLKNPLTGRFANLHHCRPLLSRLSRKLIVQLSTPEPTPLPAKGGGCLLIDDVTP